MNGFGRHGKAGLRVNGEIRRRKAEMGWEMGAAGGFIRRDGLANGLACDCGA